MKPDSVDQSDCVLEFGSIARRTQELHMNISNLFRNGQKLVVGASNLFPKELRRLLANACANYQSGVARKISDVTWGLLPQLPLCAVGFECRADLRISSSAVEFQ